MSVNFWIWSIRSIKTNLPIPTSDKDIEAVFDPKKKNFPPGFRKTMEPEKREQGNHWNIAALITAIYQPVPGCWWFWVF